MASTFCNLHVGWCRGNLAGSVIIKISPTRSRRVKSGIASMTSFLPTTTMDPVTETWTPKGNRIPRRLFKIPTDQQILLDRPEAWFDGGQPLVPQEVLEEVAKLYLQNFKGRQEPTSQSRPPDSVRHIQRSREQTPASSNRESPAPEGPTTPSSWPTSPEQHRRPPVSVSDEESEGGTTTPKGTAHKNIQRTEQPRAPANSDDGFPPSSSQVSEQGLEFEVPRAMTRILKPANKAAVLATALPGPTPPSAQIIPCSLPVHNSPPKLPQAKRRRLMKEPNFSSGEPAQSLERNMKMPAATPLAQSAVAMAVPEDAGQLPLSSVEMPPPNGRPSQVPWTAFTLAYPNLKCSLNDFVQATMCLVEYRRKWALPEFLYDDFVRVFTGEYMDYIQTTATKDPIPALKWYNMNVKKPLFTKGLLTNDNIDNVLTVYSDVVRETTRSLDTGDKPVSTPTKKASVLIHDQGSPTLGQMSPHSDELSFDPIDTRQSHPQDQSRKRTFTGTASSNHKSDPLRPRPQTIRSASRDATPRSTTMRQSPNHQKSGSSPNLLLSNASLRSGRSNTPGSGSRQEPAAPPPQSPPQRRPTTPMGLPPPSTAASMMPPPSQLSNPDSIAEHMMVRPQRRMLAKLGATSTAGVRRASGGGRQFERPPSSAASSTTSSAGPKLTPAQRSAQYLQFLQLQKEQAQKAGPRNSM